MMRRVSSLLFVLFAALLAGAPAAQAAGRAKPRVAVLEFVDKSSHYYSWYRVGRAAQDMMVTALVKGDAFRVIDRERLQALMQEKNLSLSGDVDPKTAVKVGKLLGVEYLIVGAITEFGVTNSGANVPGYGGLPSFSMRTQRMDAAVDARAINTSTGEIVWADSAKDSSSDKSVYVAGAGGGSHDGQKLDKILRPVVEKLASSVSAKKLETSGLGGTADASGVIGKIAKADGGTLYVNAGSEAGVKQGDEFNVYRVGEQIKDPDTGEVLGANEVKVGRVRITNVMGPRLSTAVSVSGSGYRAGDTLRN
ncbi:MAG TPA: CsgG/HfaB family protein [Thermoanaerobaculia bacterium]|nr:CsgG/HfaB family protein [Thermoanaerobaculia bacterium]